MSEWELAREISKCSGVFGNYEVHGVELENKSGGRAWRINVWRVGQNPVRHYCVMDGVFSSVSVELFPDSDHPMRYQKNGPATDINPEEKQAVLDAISPKNPCT